MMSSIRLLFSLPVRILQAGKRIIYESHVKVNIRGVYVEFNTRTV